MNCTEFDERLRLSVELHRPIDDPGVETHAADCRRCRDRWEEHLLLEEAVSEWKVGLPDVDLTDALLAHRAFLHSGEQFTGLAADVSSSDFTSALEAAVETETRSEQADRRDPLAAPRAEVKRVERAAELSAEGRRAVHSGRGVLAVLAVAAVVLVVVAQPFGFGRRADRPAAAPIGVADTASAAAINAETEALATKPDTRAETETDVAELVRGAGFAYLGLARDTADVFSDAVALLPTEPPIESRGSAPAGSAGDEAGPTIPLRHELQPIGRDVGQAIDFLFQTMTTAEEPAT